MTILNECSHTLDCPRKLQTVLFHRQVSREELRVVQNQIVTAETQLKKLKG